MGVVGGLPVKGLDCRSKSPGFQPHQARTLGEGGGFGRFQLVEVRWGSCVCMALGHLAWQWQAAGMWSGSVLARLRFRRLKAHIKSYIIRMGSSKFT